MRNLVLVLGDQLDAKSSAFDGFDRKQDAVWMAEVGEETERTWSILPRTVMFLTAMRHFAAELKAKEHRVLYRHLTDDDGNDSFASSLRAALQKHRPKRVIVTKPGEWNVLATIQDTVHETDIALDVRDDRHFLCSDEQFAEHANGRKQLRMEYFYRAMREKTGVLMTKDGEPEGGRWNFDPENRKSFGKRGPGFVPAPASFPPDEVTKQVIADVKQRFPKHAGKLDRFDFPVDRRQALRALKDFIEHRLPDFGTFQDAMWTGEPWLYHSRLSSAMNLKMLDPREVIAAAEEAYKSKSAPLASVEGFIRQILGWREYVRGVYWHLMPQYLERNELKATRKLPAFYWDAKTDMNCLHEAISQTLNYGYAHHIQRLMITGLFPLLLGVHPQQVHEWYLAVYVDAVEWVELPNTLGMSQFADGSVMGSKPYAASGAYISRMSNYCADCRYDPKKSVGEDACPFTTLYWDFLMRHERALRANLRMTLQLKNLERIPAETREQIARQAKEIVKRMQ